MLPQLFWTGLVCYHYYSKHGWFVTKNILKRVDLVSQLYSKQGWYVTTTILNKVVTTTNLTKVALYYHTQF